MKKLNSLKLNQLSKAELERKELGLIKGGIDTVCCSPCSCAYAGEQENEYDSYYGGSSTEDNHDANGAAVQDK